MLKSRLLTLFYNEDRKPPNEDAEISLPRPSFSTRHSSTPSGIALGKRIQRHLDAGNPLYIGFDPADQRNEDEEEEERIDCIKRMDNYKKWLRVFTLGAPLDIAAKFILTVGITMALLAILWSINWLIIQNSQLDKDFNLVMIIGQSMWGVFFGASCIFGMELMWGKWKRSPAAALFFTICWVFVSLILLVASIIWFYLYFVFRASRIQKCMEKTVKVTITWDNDSLRRMAPQSQIDRCLERVDSKVNWALVWGITYAIFSYSGIIAVIWGRIYRRRLLEIKDCEETRNFRNSGGNDKVGLLLGTAPLGRLSSSRIIGSRKSGLERDQGSEGGMRPSTTRRTEERNDTEIVIRISTAAAPYGNQKNTPPLLHSDERVGVVSGTKNVTSMGSDISVEGQRFADVSH